MFTSKEIRKERRKLCRGCKYYRPEASFKINLWVIIIMIVLPNKEQCAKCSCLIKEKTILSGSKCKLKPPKW